MILENDDNVLIEIDGDDYMFWSRLFRDLPGSGKSNILCKAVERRAIILSRVMLSMPSWTSTTKNQILMIDIFIGRANDFRVVLDSGRWLIMLFNEGEEKINEE